jgi:hypothetical protein
MRAEATGAVRVATLIEATSTTSVEVDRIADIVEGVERDWQ